jgi:peptide/nickel transport system substrate-binding protein
VPAIEQVNTPGSTIWRGYQDVWDHWGPTEHNNRALCWRDSDQVVRPGIAESWQVNADATEWTFHIRPGLKCYDGSPLDSDSFKWTWENRYLNETLTPSPPSNLSTGYPRVMGEMTFPDQYTFVIRHREPKPTLLFDLGLWPHFWTPGAYMEQFHQDFADKGELETKVTEAGFETWDQLFDDRLGGYMGTKDSEDMPQSAESAASGDTSTIKHSPYLWASDPASAKPPKGHWFWEIRELWDKIAVEPDEDKRNELFEGILDIWVEELPHFSYLKESPAGTRAKNGFPLDSSTSDKHLLSTETCFWDDPDV